MKILRVTPGVVAVGVPCAVAPEATNSLSPQIAQPATPVNARRVIMSSSHEKLVVRLSGKSSYAVASSQERTRGGRHRFLAVPADQMQAQPSSMARTLLCGR